MSELEYSVVIPAFNAEKYIEQTLQSLLMQTVRAREIIVVDDGSTDRTAVIAAQYHHSVKVISTANQGAGSATSQGLNQVSSDIVALIDSDDLWHPNKSALQLKILKDTSLQCDAILTKIEAFGDTHLKTTIPEHSHWSRSTLMIKMSAYRKVGEVRDMPNGYGEMIDWFSRAKDCGLKFQLVDEVLAYRRIHSDSLSFKADHKHSKDFLRIAKLALERKKKSN